MLDEFQDGAFGLGSEEAVQIELVLNRMVTAPEPTQFAALKTRPGKLDSSPTLDLSFRRKGEPIFVRFARRGRGRGRVGLAPRRATRGTGPILPALDGPRLSYVTAEELKVVVVRWRVHFFGSC